MPLCVYCLQQFSYACVCLTPRVRSPVKYKLTCVGALGGCRLIGGVVACSGALCAVARGRWGRRYCVTRRLAGLVRRPSCCSCRRTMNKHRGLGKSIKKGAKRNGILFELFGSAKPSRVNTQSWVKQSYFILYDRLRSFSTFSLARGTDVGLLLFVSHHFCL